MSIEWRKFKIAGEKRIQEVPLAEMRRKQRGWKFKEVQGRNTDSQLKLLFL